METRGRDSSVENFIFTDGEENEKIVSSAGVGEMADYGAAVLFFLVIKAKLKRVFLEATGKLNKQLSLLSISALC
jgi:hypothetical protein